VAGDRDTAFGGVLASVGAESAQERRQKGPPSAGVTAR